MTKLVTSIAAMQVVEQGLIGLDDDLGKIVPALSGLNVLQDFDKGDTSRYTKQTKPVTLRYFQTSLD